MNTKGNGIDSILGFGLGSKEVCCVPHFVLMMGLVNWIVVCSIHDYLEVLDYVVISNMDICYVGIYILIMWDLKL